MNAVIDLSGYYGFSLDGIKVPGAVQSVAVNGEIIVDSSNSAGNASPRKVMRGFADKSISINLNIVDMDGQTALQQLEFIERLFKRLNSNVPKVFTIADEHVLARGIGQVIFKSLSSSQSSGSDIIEASLSFEEFRPASVARE